MTCSKCMVVIVRVAIVALSVSWSATPSAAQEAIRTDGVCLFSSATSVQSLYTFPSDRRSVELLDKFVEASGAAVLLTIQASSVDDVAAADVDGRRLILYNQYAISKLDQSWQGNWPLMLRLAHQVGHHANAHAFRIEASARIEEELEADRFAGYVLRRLGATKAVVTDLSRAFPSPARGAPFPSKERRASALTEGWRDRDGEEANPHAFESGIDGIPMLPSWPPPTASANTEITRDLLTRANVRTTLQDVADRLLTALDRAGYAERSFYAVPQGFALVSRMEQIYPDGRPREGDARWPVKAAPPPIFSLASYLRALFSTNPGFYRVIAFVITNRPFVQGAAKGDNPPRQWVWAGANRLPTVVGFADYTSEYSCTALVYEFQRVSNSRDASVVLPGTLPGRTHLDRARLLSALSLR